MSSKPLQSVRSLDALIVYLSLHFVALSPDQRNPARALQVD
jgi:hypothetical protein